MDSESRLIWFFDHFNPYFQAGDSLLVLLCAGFCFWSAARHPNVGIILLGIGCTPGATQGLLFCASAFQEGRPFLPFLPFDFRKGASSHYLKQEVRCRRNEASQNRT